HGETAAAQVPHGQAGRDRDDQRNGQRKPGVLQVLEQADGDAVAAVPVLRRDQPVPRGGEVTQKGPLPFIPALAPWRATDTARRRSWRGARASHGVSQRRASTSRPSKIRASKMI